MELRVPGGRVTLAKPARLISTSAMPVDASIPSEAPTVGGRRSRSTRRTCCPAWASVHARLTGT